MSENSSHQSLLISAACAALLCVKRFKNLKVLTRRVRRRRSAEGAEKGIILRSLSARNSTLAACLAASLLYTTSHNFRQRRDQLRGFVQRLGTPEAQVVLLREFLKADIDIVKHFDVIA